MTDVLKSMPGTQRAALRTLLMQNQDAWLDNPASINVTLAVMAVLEELAPKGVRRVRDADLKDSCWYRIVTISPEDPHPRHAVGDILQARADAEEGELSCKRDVDSWLVLGCTRISCLEEVDPP
jgi:hypothetical protein